ncbi:MAG TPA: DNA repair protein RadC [Candidatus Binatia bacterium]|nr:DNA repair protein RadC [Candidatus Binatia bacterium]
MNRGLMMKELPEGERPRERLARDGPDGLKASDLVAIILRTGTRGSSALAIGQELVTQYRTLDNLSRATIPDLCKVKGIGRDKAVTLVAAFTLARQMAKEIRPEAPTLDTPERIADLLREENRGYGVENFQVVLLNTRRKLLRVDKISQGTLDTILVHPREVFKPAIAASAAALVLVHNHPSGVIPHPVLCRM